MLRCILLPPTKSPRVGTAVAALFRSIEVPVTTILRNEETIEEEK